MAIINDGFGSASKLVGTEQADLINGFDLNDVIEAAGGNDSIFAGDGNDTVAGGNGNDFIDGGVGNDNLSGNGDNDTINDFFGNNILQGFSGDDTLTAGAGNDVFIGGLGSDRMTGGGGADIFDFRLAFGGTDQDIVTDFVAGTDKITGLAFNNINIDFASVANDSLAATSSASIVYSRSTGSLFLNTNRSASGFGGFGKIATFQGNPNISGRDFIPLEL
ncbi:hypothetical protein HJG54_33225 [Leptolyngbya sp. NK1-12]|uniref:Calcium-binding protein n=1 Tax=Leptolyngbya sp. NK1-12 TaxID=2547451 RepID=A0AA96WMV3_9CYAN|nr:calcium-binding protein [Leptolyngbya sp. NK1-12]WNZ27710.1 hypothetical protein HJG54_33225 [Leptolyngbya sp. NK1-12]